LTYDRNDIVCRRENFLDSTYSFDYCKEIYPTGWQIYEPEPKEPQQQINSSSEPGVHQVIFAEPAPRLKVGDWVEVLVVSKNIELTEQRKVVDVADDGYALNQPYSNFNHLDWIGWDNVPIQKHTGIIKVLRILQPSEVKVTLSLEGTVRRINDLYFSLNPSKEVGWVVPEATIPYDMLSPAQAALVKELVED